jgi:hypothetical protein
MEVNSFFLMWTAHGVCLLLWLDYGTRIVPTTEANRAFSAILGAMLRKDNGILGKIMPKSA